MLRAVLAVALAVALLAAANPALDAAKTTRTERLAQSELDRIEAAAESLLYEENPATPGNPGPRRTLTVSLPGESPTAAPLAFVALGGVPGETSAADTAKSDVFTAKLAGGRHQVRRVDFDLRAAVPADENLPSGDNRGWRVAPDAEPLVLSGGETHRLVLRLVQFDGRPTVLVTARRFKFENGTTPSHARPTGATS